MKIATPRTLFLDGGLLVYARWYVLMIQLFFVTLAYTFSITIFYQFLFSILTILIFSFVNLYFSFIQTSKKLNFLQVFIDLLIFSALIYFNGGASNPFLFLIAVHVLLAQFFINKKENIVFIGLVFLSIVTQKLSPFTLNEIPSIELTYLIVASITALSIWQISNWLIHHTDQMYSRLNQMKNFNLRIDKFRALGLLTSGVCHELGTPLNTVLMRLDRLKKIKGVSEDENFKIIESNIEKSISSLTQLNSQIHDESGDFFKQKTELLSTIKKTVENYNKDIDTEINFYPNTLDNIYIDIPPMLFIQSFLDILDNAVEAKSTKIEIKLIKHLDECEISISDNGEGMAPHILKMAGNPFNTSKEYGTGLGLYQFHNIIQLASGHVKISRSIPNGTQILVNIPIDKSKEGQS